MAAVSPLAVMDLPRTLLFGTEPLQPFPTSILKANSDNEIVWLQNQLKK
jgi:hypothetical protein